MFDCCLGNIRHEQVAAGVRQAASCRRRSLLVVAAGAAQQAEGVEGQDQDDHTEHCHTADPPAAQTHTLTVVVCVLTKRVTDFFVPTTTCYMYTAAQTCRTPFGRPVGNRTLCFSVRR